MKKPLSIAVIAALAIGSTAGAHASDVRTLATHPECVTAGNSIVVRGAVAFDETYQPAEGARVRVQAGGRSALSTPTDAAGRYTAVIVDVPDARQAEVREVATYYGNSQTGSLLRQMSAQSFGGTCHASAVILGVPKKTD